MSSLIFIYITNPSEKEAKRIAKHLLEKKLIACANIFPIKSMYRWKGKINYEKEFAMIAKTISKNFEKIKNEVEKMHPYKIPCIIKISVQANDPYSAWLRNSVK